MEVARKYQLEFLDFSTIPANKMTEQRLDGGTRTPAFRFPSSMLGIEKPASTAADLLALVENINKMTARERGGGHGWNRTSGAQADDERHPGGS